MKKPANDAVMTNPLDLFTEEIIHAILDHLNDDPFSKKSFSLCCKSFYFIESRHRKSLTPLRSELLNRALHRYPSISRLNLTLCPRVSDATLASVAATWRATLRSINLSRSRDFSGIGLRVLSGSCSGLVEIDVSNGTELTDTAAKAIAEAKNLEKLRMARCKLISDIGIGCIAVGCKKLKVLCLRWCLRVTDLGVGLVAVKCKQLRSLDLSCLPITEKCLPPILQLQHLEDLVLEGCLGIDDDGLVSLKHCCSSLKMLNLSKCQNVSHVGLSSLTNGADNLEQLILSYGPSVTTDLGKCLLNYSRLKSIRLDGCLVTCSGTKAIGSWCASLRELSLSKCTGVTDECLSFLVQAHRQLLKLDIVCCRKITSVAIDCITKSCTFLTSLRMESCSLVSKDAFLLIGQRCQFLEELDVTDNEIDDEGLMSISRCSKLCSLKLGVCLNITDEGLMHVGSGCRKLKELDLYRSLGVTDVGIAKIAQGCPDLEMINIAYNNKITDSSLISLSECLRLKILELRGCPCVSTVGLSAVARGCRQLAVLDIKKCVNINDNGMLALGQFCHNLRQINLSYCSVTDVGLLSLANTNRLQNMTILHLTGLSPNGLAAALLACGGLTKVKLHTSLKPLLPKYIFEYMEGRGCVFHWRDKAFQVEIDPKGWQLHVGRSPER
ncbi:putative leucine-rich repeat domain, L domain-containing protein [Rosa chinensis]|uniref:Putative leucine-rich repeat domain, L domain-containing protein n=1 Tax=Rosa chinensis TaxID=74649 RepID=A0A2P6QKH7_ROSCH|nr:F-box/LRR-repeat protein 3 [Rosa chinensis]PRQ34684.1 putative leucine-rich repeat domain, L domain-containing protein [Rosa chinensis]